MRSTADATQHLQRAARALLASPMLVRGIADDDTFRLVRTYAADLREWFDRETGWRLRVDAEVARLFKVAATTRDATYPARDPRHKVGFGRQRYVLICLALGCLERADGQITLGRLADQLLLVGADPDLAAAGFRFALDGVDRRERRGDLVAVARLLISWGALHRLAGAEEAFLGSNGDVLYDVDRRVVAGILAGTKGPSLITTADHDRRLVELTSEITADTDDSRNRALRHALTRRLLEEPVVYYDELSPDELAYLTRQRAAIIGRITDLTGLIAEVRAEGIAMVDPDDELTDLRMPAQGMQSHLTLLLAGAIAATPTGQSVSDLHLLTRRLASEHKAYWRKNATDPGAEVDLVAEALATLRALKLIAVEGESVVPRPAIARYAVAPPTVSARREEQ
ncbi:uncharacterized protein (TIGR02678 family) [Allocatelliglobosispora scoriae]|uniref:Uncharacterized protein (TIGR02678 family) n=1 Tax=Allocatelliglobosispora scoriae TaxID=643052 RepID=A0A841BP61_9ACTN|nr:TIGR02678 family protein [Allocatelliglobosispora scoriae]MBB5868600.1 uncharacterized protein (TIGR02678 family) [Allocatelliglobosispora scoriae]